MEAADIASEIIAQSKGGVHVAFAFSTSCPEGSLEVRDKCLLFISNNNNGEKLYHVVVTKGDKLLELKYSSVDSAVAFAVCQAYSTNSYGWNMVLYKKDSPTLVNLSAEFMFEYERGDEKEESIKAKLHLIDVVGLVEGRRGK